MKNVFRLMLMIVLAGCATTKNYEKILNTWVGVNADNLISSWGPPQRSYRLSDGGEVLEYHRARNVKMGGYTYVKPQTTYHAGTTSISNNYGGSAHGTYTGITTTYVEKKTPTYDLNLRCITRFTTDPNGIIINWGWQGNDCIASPPK